MRDALDGTIREYVQGIDPVPRECFCTCESCKPQAPDETHGDDGEASWQVKDLGLRVGCFELQENDFFGANSASWSGLPMETEQSYPKECQEVRKQKITATLS